MELPHEQQIIKSAIQQRRRRIVVLVVIMAVLCVVSIAAVNYCKIIKEKLNISCCVSNLKQLANSLDIYPNDQKNGENESLRHFPPWEALVDNGYIDKETQEKLKHCPKTHTEYIYVRYNRPVARVSSTAAANTPVLFDSVIGCHKDHIKTNVLGMGIEIPWTLVAFENGLVSVEKNLTCFKELYDRHAPFMSKEDAEVLLKCCEEADRRILGE